ncbi:MAG: LysR family transcriptional regulator [Alphaproteobacteria bacterium]|nr:LysR family transcriptional regulator [Alphaproteobacteria bacterium]
MHNLDWDGYRYFAAVARHGGLAPAARALGVHHSTVFRRIAALEAAAGVRLFDRRSEGYVLTPSGEAVQAALADVEDGIHRVERHIMSADPGLSGVVRMTTTEDIAQFLIARQWNGFAAAYPEIRLEMIVANRFFNLSRREADIAIRPSRDPEGDMVGRRAADIAIAAYAATEYLARMGRPSRPSDLRRHRLIACDDSLAHLAVARWLKRYDDGGNVVLRSNSFVVQHDAVRAGLGIGLLPCFVVGDDGLERLWPLRADLVSGLWVLTHRDLRRTPRIRAVLDYFFDAFAAERGRLAT